ncbi:cell cycle checkpoint protein RAD17, partial [Aplochiton taeniatus]
SSFPSSSRELVQRDQDEPWVDQYIPRSQAELAVHKKKIEEVETWMRMHSTNLHTAKGGAILLLTGPSGCGKSATLRVLAQDQGLTVQEWTNPCSVLSEYKPEPDAYQHTFDPSSPFNGFHGASQSGQFQEFLLRANKYNCLQMDGGGGASDRKIIVVEDFPNQFYRHPESLHDILRRFVRTGRQPLVFVVSDSLSGDSSSRLLFPKDIQEELSVSHISFNPVAPTSMMKVLSRIAILEAGKSGGRMTVPDKAALDLLCSGSSGDIRSAINSLQFCSLTDHSLEKGLWQQKKGKTATSLKAVSKATRGKRKWKDGEREKEQAIGGKDASLFLFRALGKILYVKRDSAEVSSVGACLPSHLAEHHRDKMLLDPELVVERSHMSGEFFNLFLQQNYLDFFSDMNDVARASDYLADADLLTSEWTSRDSMGLYSSSVATRGLLHSNSAQVSAGFKPLHKPGWLLVNKKYRENCLVAQSLFTNFCVTPVSLQTELLPYLALLTNPLRNQAQIAFIQDVGRLSQRRFPARQRLEALTDKDPGMMELDSEEEEEGGQRCSSSTPASSSLSGDPGGQGEPSLESPLPDSQGPASQPQPTTSEALLEEQDQLIEEYDSD